ncbi:Uncharacterised protein [Mycobacterium tuberculosis]|nr:Uncharacterised protein [Mycobacterium tuberculosis]CMR11728.1 Uncharacterised protein [Mycobacterium tuberculosis]
MPGRFMVSIHNALLADHLVDSDATAQACTVTAGNHVGDYGGQGGHDGK